MSPQEKHFGVDLTDEVVRGSIVTYKGEIIPPSPRLAPTAAPLTPPQAAVEPPKSARTVALTPYQKASREVATVTTGLGAVLALGKTTGPLFMSNVLTFTLAGLVGYRAVWGVAPALHSPLMSVTNAISGSRTLSAILRLYSPLIIGMVGIGGFFIMGGGLLPETLPQALGALSVLLAFVNVSGGFVITKRMLDMFKRTYSFFSSTLVNINP